MVGLFRYYVRRLGNRLLQYPLFLRNPLFRGVVSLRLRHKVSRVENGIDPPAMLTLENTSICNAKCIMCPYPDMERDKIIMDHDLYLKGLMDAKELGIQWVQPQYFGEPLVDKELERKIKAAKEMGLKVSIFTNGSLMNEDKARMLIESGIDEVKVSIDSCKPEVYEKIRKGLKFDTVVQNVKRLMDLKRSMGKVRPQVWVMFVEFAENHGEVREYYKYWSKLVDEVNISRSHNWGGKQEVSGLTILGGEYRFPCPSPWEQMVVNAQGTILPCCCDYEGDSLGLGNLRDMTLREAWEGEPMRKLRQMHLAKRFHEVKLCDDCQPNDIW